MNNEQLELISEAHNNYVSYWGNPINPINYKLYGATTNAQCFHPEDRLFTEEEFINKCKTYNEFSKMWKLKIEERGLRYEERIDLYIKKFDAIDGTNFKKYEHTIPSKLITITYNNKTIESYE